MACKRSSVRVRLAPFMDDQFQKIANRVVIVTIACNIFLTLYKIITGILAHSGAMVSDGVHSASDVISSLIVMIGIKFASKEPDMEHPYGHERLECVAAFILAVFLFLTGLGIGAGAVRNIMSKDHESLLIPGFSALVAAVVSVIIKELMFQYTKKYAIQIDSAALMADAWHHRSDALSSVGALAGIWGARMGYPLMDSLASLVIFIFIARAAIDIFKDAMDKMVDHACDANTEKEIYECALKNGKVRGIDVLHTRIFGNKIYVDMEIRLDEKLTLLEAHEIAEEVHEDIEKNFPKVKHIMIHVNPDTPES